MNADGSNEATGPEQYGSQPPLMPYPQSAPQSRIGRNTIVFAVLVFLLIAVPVVVNAMTTGDRRSSPPVPQRTLSLPGSVDGYEHMSGNVADRLIAGMRKSDADTSAVERAIDQKATMALYEKAKDFDRRFIFVGFSTSDDPAFARELRGTAPSRIVDNAFRGGREFPDPRDFSPGPLGGVLRCGAGKSYSGELTLCVWADGSTTGTLTAPGNVVEELAGLTLAFRTVAES
jgi:hypothetical protein